MIAHVQQKVWHRAVSLLRNHHSDRHDQSSRCCDTATDNFRREASASGRGRRGAWYAATDSTSTQGPVPSTSSRPSTNTSWTPGRTTRSTHISLLDVRVSHVTVEVTELAKAPDIEHFQFPSRSSNITHKLDTGAFGIVQREVTAVIGAPGRSHGGMLPVKAD